MRMDAFISSDGLYRYSLTRAWDASLPIATWCMLNPSTADATKDDPTIRRVIGLSRSWGFGSVEVVNLFAFRSTDPAQLSVADDPIGPDNDAAINRAAGVCGAFIAAWGNIGPYRGRAASVLKMLSDRQTPVWCWAVSKTGQPKHPLYAPGSCSRILYIPAVKA